MPDGDAYLKEAMGRAARQGAPEFGGPEPGRIGEIPGGNPVLSTYVEAVPKGSERNQIDYFVEQRWLNRFRRQENPTLDQHDPVPRPAATGHITQRQSGVICHNEMEFIDYYYVRRDYVVEQAYEIWRINGTLKAYYDFVTGKAVSVPVGVAGLMALSGVAGGETVTVAGALTDAALGGGGALVTGLLAAPTVAVTSAAVGGFVLGTYMSRGLQPDQAGLQQMEAQSKYKEARYNVEELLTSSGWAFLKHELGPEEEERKSAPYWKPWGAPYPCLPRKVRFRGTPPKAPLQKGRGRRGVAVGLGASLVGAALLFAAAAGAGPFARTDVAPPDTSVGIAANPVAGVGPVQVAPPAPAAASAFSFGAPAVRGEFTFTDLVGNCPTGGLSPTYKGAWGITMPTSGVLSAQGEAFAASGQGHVESDGAFSWTGKGELAPGSGISEVQTLTGKFVMTGAGVGTASGKSHLDFSGGGLACAADYNFSAVLAPAGAVAPPPAVPQALVGSGTVTFTVPQFGPLNLNGGVRITTYRCQGATAPDGSRGMSIEGVIDGMPMQGIITATQTFFTMNESSGAVPLRKDVSSFGLRGSGPSTFVASQRAQGTVNVAATNRYNISGTVTIDLSCR